MIAQNETSTSQKFTNLQIVGDLSASTTCRCQLLRCCDQLAEGAIILSTITYEPIPVNLTNGLFFSCKIHQGLCKKNYEVSFVIKISELKNKQTMNKIVPIPLKEYQCLLSSTIHGW